MLLSMTGFGRFINNYQDKTITVEIRSLNSKFTDLRFKVPQNYKNLEPDLRRIITSSVDRGKIDVNVEIKSLSGDEEFALNSTLFKKYYTELNALSNELKMDQGDLMQAILKLPNVVASENSEVDEEEWAAVQNTLKQAIENFNTFRRDEGESMKSECMEKATSIKNNLALLAPFEEERIKKLRARMQQNMDEYIGKENIDANRFEQEILYYLEKIDITEEKVRLEQHCKYFLSELDSNNSTKGRKLSFITQEMGREINTLGSKANSSDIQRVVVLMKDDLEKIKELVANAV